MFDIGWSELLIIGVVALIVVGPKDLPGMFKQLGLFTAKMRRMAREFSRAMEDAADASGAKDIAKDLRGIQSMASPGKSGMNAITKAAGLDGFDPLADDDDAAAEKKPRGPATEALSKERAEAAAKIHEATAVRAQARLDAEAAARNQPDPGTASEAMTETETETGKGSSAGGTT